MAKGFEINNQAIRNMTREIEREFAKNPVRVPLQADPSAVMFPPATTVNNYHGPVVTVSGGNAQIAWGNDTVNQTQSQQIAPGYEELARLVTDLLANLGPFSLVAEDAEDVRSSAQMLLGEVVKEEPDRGVIRRGVNLIKGVLAPIMAGMGQAATAETAEASRHVIESLGQALPV